MSFISVVTGMGRAALSGGAPSTPAKAAGTGAGAMQVRRLSLVQEPAGPGGEPASSERRVTRELGRARSLSMNGGEPAHGISMSVSRFDGKSFAYDVGGRLIVGEDAPMLADLQVIFQGLLGAAGKFPKHVSSKGSDPAVLGPRTG